MTREEIEEKVGEILEWSSSPEYGIIYSVAVEDLTDYILELLKGNKK